jgi:hypothetical protein
MKDKSRHLGNGEVYLTPDQNGAWPTSSPPTGTATSRSRRCRRTSLGAEALSPEQPAHAHRRPAAFASPGGWPAGAAADGATVLVAYLGHMLWTLGFRSPVRAPFPPPTLSGWRSTSACSTTNAGRKPAQPGGVRGAVHRGLPGDRHPAGHLHGPEGARRRCAAHHLPVPLRHVLRRHRPGLAVGDEPRSRPAARGAQLGFESFTFDWIVDPDRVIYTIVIAGGVAGLGPGDGAGAGRLAGWTKRSGRPRASKASRLARVPADRAAHAGAHAGHHLRAAVCRRGEGL